MIIKVAELLHQNSYKYKTSIQARDSTLNPIEHCRSGARSPVRQTKSTPTNTLIHFTCLQQARRAKDSDKQQNVVDRQIPLSIIAPSLPYHYHNHCRRILHPNPPPKSSTTHNDHHHHQQTYHQPSKCPPRILNNNPPLPRQNNGPTASAQLDRPVLMESGAAVRVDWCWDDGVL